MTKTYIIPTIRVKSLETETPIASASYEVIKEDVTSEDILSKPDTHSVWDE